MKKTISIYPTVDTYIDSSLPLSNFCDKSYYFLGYFKLSTKYRVLMKFDLNKIPLNAVIKKAEFKVYCVRNDCLEQQNNFEIHCILDQWDDFSVSFDNQPRFDQENCVLMSAGFSLDDQVSTDITEMVQKWVSRPDSNDGILIKAENETDQESLVALQSSREGYRDWKPCIELALEIPEPVLEATDKEKKIAILTPQFFEWNGERCLFGGGERYLAELAQLIISMGFQVDVFQPSNSKPWKREYNGINIYGIDDSNFDEDFFIQANRKFYLLTQEYDLHIYLTMDLIYPFVFPNSVCISHGIWWDSSERKWWRSEKWYQRLFDGLNQIKTLVCVDTNTINWLNAVNPDTLCEKAYIPNYVDLTVFKPEDTAENRNTVKVLYPRRLVPDRGWCVTKEVAKELVTEREDLSFSFVGRGSETAERQMNILASKYPKIDYEWHEMGDMNQVYKNADIVLIPSYCSEGTSFSLIEAMACGKPVIAGLVGGLTDLVINGFNGFLIQVSKNTLKDSILKLAADKELRKEMGENALRISQSFSKRIWEKRWQEIIHSHIYGF